MAKRELKVSTIDELKKSVEGEIVELPPFSESVPFVARMTRPSMMDLVTENKIPNQLLEDANNLFTSGPSGVMTKKMSNPKVMTELRELMDVVCESAFLEPKYHELKEAGIKLSDDQYMFVFGYVQKGVKALQSFRG